MRAMLPIFGFVAFIAFGIAQFIAGYAGIAHGLGTGWAIAAVIAGFAFRFTLPITIGAFFGAMNVWGWPWIGALVFAAPGLILVVPGVLGSIIGAVRAR
jgi:hypothetical protein